MTTGRIAGRLPAVAQSADRVHQAPFFAGQSLREAWPVVPEYQCEQIESVLMCQTDLQRFRLVQCRRHVASNFVQGSFPNITFSALTS